MLSYKCFNNCMRADKVQINNVSSKVQRVDLNNLIKKVKEDEKKNRRTNIVISAAAVSAVAVFGIILTL